MQHLSLGKIFFDKNLKRLPPTSGADPTTSASTITTPALKKARAFFTTTGYS
jgi:hypothetical protein